MKRRDLVPGTVFTYKNGTGLYCVEYDGNGTEAIRSIPTESDLVRDVTVLWAPLDSSPSPDADHKIATAAAKPQLSILTILALAGEARVRAYGAKKYQPGNYLKATFDDGAPQRYLSALLRHVGQMQEKNGLFTKESLSALDEESGLPHIDHAICSLRMLREILTKDGILPEDPGQGKEPPK